MNGALASVPMSEYGEDVRVAQCRSRAGFLLEAVEAIDIGREDTGQDLDRHVTPEPRIAYPLPRPCRPRRARTRSRMARGERPV